MCATNLPAYELTGTAAISDTFQCKSIAHAYLIYRRGGWRVTLAGCRFVIDAKKRYTGIEGRPWESRRVGA